MKTIFAFIKSRKYFTLLFFNLLICTNISAQSFSSESIESARTMYEKAFDITLDDAQFEELKTPSKANSIQWQKVKMLYEKDSNVNLSYVYFLIKKGESEIALSTKRKAFKDMTNAEKLEHLEKQFKDGKVNVANYEAAKKEYLLEVKKEESNKLKE